MVGDDTCFGGDLNNVCVFPRVVDLSLVPEVVESDIILVPPGGAQPQQQEEPRSEHVHCVLVQAHWILVEF